jgi:LTXXQ motif family protein
MERRAYHVAFPASLVVVLVAFLSTILVAGANPSFAATAKKKAPAVARTSAVEHTEARIVQLQVALKITEDQEPLWSNLTLVMRDNAKSMDALTKDRADNKKKLNTVEYMKFQSQISEARSEQLKRFIPPFEALYASLSDEQKTTIDALFRTGKHGKHRMN